MCTLPPPTWSRDVYLTSPPPGLEMVAQQLLSLKSLSNWSRKTLLGEKKAHFSFKVSVSTHVVYVGTHNNTRFSSSLVVMFYLFGNAHTTHTHTHTHTHTYMYHMHIHTIHTIHTHHTYHTHITHTSHTYHTHTTYIHTSYTHHTPHTPYTQYTPHTYHIHTHITHTSHTTHTIHTHHTHTTHISHTYITHATHIILPPHGTTHTHTHTATQSTRSQGTLTKFGIHTSRIRGTIQSRAPIVHPQRRWREETVRGVCLPSGQATRPRVTAAALQVSII